MDERILNEGDMKEEEKSVLFVVLPTISHYHSMWGLCKAYSEKGYKVYATTTRTYQNLVKKLGYEPIIINYISEFRFFNLRTFLKVVILSLFDKSFSAKNRYRELVSTGHQFDKILAKTKPSEVFIDAHLSFYAIFLNSLINKIKVVETKLLTSKQNCIPPLYIDRVFRNNCYYRIISELYWLKHGYKKIVSKVLNKIAFIGQDENRMIFLYAGKRNLSGIFKKNHKCSFNYLELNDCFEKLIVSPLELEYPWRHLKPNEKEFRYKGFYKQKNMNLYPDLKQWLDKINQSKRINSNCKLIYCSFGSRNLTSKKIFVFFDELIKVIENHKDWFLIISSNILFNQKGNNKYNSVAIFNYVPQTSILKFCDLMINQGGANNIRECIEQKIKMIVLPHNYKFDQPGNAARIKFHGYGIKNNIYKMNPRKIPMLIEKALKLEYPK